MSIDFAAYSGKSNVGFNIKVQEDYILFNENDFGDEMLFAAVADGTGAKESMFRPAAIVTNQIETVLKRFYSKNPVLFKNNIRLLMEEAVLQANDVLIGFKTGNEEERYNFASTITCMILERDGRMTMAHMGNTRLYVIRDGNVLQISKDHTEGQLLVDTGKISKENYYTAIERLRLYNGAGISANPFVQTAQLQLAKNDVIIMTSDGIHYSYRSEAFYDILINTDSMDDTVQEMIKTALDLRVYPDNISANAIWYLGNDVDTPHS